MAERNQKLSAHFYATLPQLQDVPWHVSTLLPQFPQHLFCYTIYILDAVEKIGAKRVLLDSIKDIEIATPDKVRYKDYI
ncbi:hypothetical protein [Coleofasciculus sp. E1-EBD-02]|uniref:hypothetical protein n=1 Tax=Coleofasciculus sp. E1-EBD-02 TaxID=3068481 RepID=UPI0032FAEEF7